MNRENLHGKNPTGWFSRHHSRKFHYYHNKRLQVKESNLQLNHYPNTQLDLFYNDNFSF